MPKSRKSNPVESTGDDDFEVCPPRIALSASSFLDLVEWAGYEPAAIDGEETASPMRPPEASGSESTGISIESEQPIRENTDPQVASETAASTGELFLDADRIRQSGGPDGSGQTVVVIDTGIAADHISLGGKNAFGPGYRIVGGWDFAENDAVPYDDGPSGYHGTHIASLLAGRQEAADRVAQDLTNAAFSGQPEATNEGMAPGADLIALRVFDDLGRSNSDWVQSALRWVHEHQDAFDSPITTVNLSIGASDSQASIDVFQAAISDELALLAEDDILVFAAAGNQNTDGVPLAYPAADANVIAVGALDATGDLANFSGREPEIWAAPGVDIPGAVPEHVHGWDGNVDDLTKLTGTSVASPQIAGASMLIRQALGQAGLADDGQSAMQWLRDHAEIRAQDDGGFVFLPDLEATMEAIRAKVETPAVESTTYHGDHGHDRLRLDLNEERWTVNDLQNEQRSWAVAGDAELGYQIDGGHGGDSIKIIGSEGSDRVILRAGGVSEIVAGGRRLEISGFNRIEFVGGGTDRVSLFDSAGDDTLHSQSNRSTLEGVGYSFEVTGTREVYAHGTSGGFDSAILRDTGADDRWVVRPEFTSLRTAGNGLNGDGYAEDRFRMAFGFEQVQAFARMGGDDTLEIFDSPNSENLSLSDRHVVLAGTDYRVTASGFDRVDAWNSGAGNDQVRVYVDDVESLRAEGFVDDRHLGSIGMDTESGAELRAHGFESAEVFEDYAEIDFESWLETQHNDLLALFDALSPIPTSRR